MIEEEETGYWEEVKPVIEIWIPRSIDEELQGVITSIEEGQYGLYAVIDCGNGKKVRTPSHRILQSRLEECNVGDKVRIVYKGKTRTASGRWAENYSVLIWRKKEKEGESNEHSVIHLVNDREKPNRRER